MELVEIRDLDGPNLFLLQPAIKLELRAADAGVQPEALSELQRRLGALGISDEGRRGGYDALGDLLVEATRALHRRAGAGEPEIVWSELETPGHRALAFGWNRRAFALSLAKAVAAVAVGEPVDLAEASEMLRGLAVASATKEDLPQIVWDRERTIPVIAVTGTNGKTTTTRLIAHTLRLTGRKVGWSSSTGVYIEGREVVRGDYTGPQGARRVLEEPGLDVAVLETARGGILLRGIAYESNDVSVFTNVSGDHLDLQGIRTVEGLARVKATVVRVTRADGFAVLNADDPLVRGVAGPLRASPFLVSQNAWSPFIVSHVAAGGHALFVRDGEIVFARRGEESAMIRVDEAPLTFGGRAKHMVENALSAAAGCLAFGLEPAEVSAGLSSFRNSPELNIGRLNVFDVGGVTVVVDFAHNEAGLTHLLDLSRSLLAEGGRLLSIIGTAGDRRDEALRELGRLAAVGSDQVIIKETDHYLRGRLSNEEMNRLYVAGIEEGGGTPWQIEPSEVAALDAALLVATPGDAIAIMCVEQIAEVQKKLAELGRSVS